MIETGGLTVFHELDAGDAALEYAARGFRVVPLHSVKAEVTPSGPAMVCSCSRGAACAKSAGKHPRLGKWQEFATADGDKVGAWFNRWPASNVGIAMGGAERLLALDVDGPDGAASLAELEAKHGQLPRTLTSRSGRADGGEHRIFRIPDELAELGNRVGNGKAFAKGLDVRGSGGQIVVAPSMHRSGAVYRWTDDASIADLPKWLYDLIQAKPEQAIAPLPAPMTPGSSRGIDKVERARKYLSNIEGAIEGEQGGTHTFVTAQKIGRGFDLDEQTTYELLAGDFNRRCDPPWTEQDLWRKVRQAFREGTFVIGSLLNVAPPARAPRPNGTPRYMAPEHQELDDEDLERAAIAAEPPKAKPPSSPAPPGAWKSFFKCDDIGNAERLVAQHGQDLRYCVGLGWFAWDGKRWRHEDTGEEVRRAIVTVRSIADEAAKIEAEDQRTAVEAWGKKSGGAERVGAMVRLAKSHAGIATTPAALDADPWLLNVGNGTLDLRTGELVPHRRDTLATKLAPVSYVPSAACPRWMQFLEETQPDVVVRSFLQRLIGYSLTGVIREHVLPIHYGDGRNGKGVFINTILAVLGGYGAAPQASLLMAKPGAEEHPTGLTMLLGCRLAAISETKQGQSIDVALVKQLTGGDPVTARRMRENFFTFDPTHKLMLSTNHRPGIRETKDAIWSRVMLIPWLVSFKGREDFALTDKLKTELEGILAWAVRGCLQWQAVGLLPPASVLAATKSYREDQDTFGDFLTEKCILESDAKVTRKALRLAYETWAKEVGDRNPVGPKLLAENLRERGCVEVSVRADGLPERGWKGLRLKTGGDIYDEGQQQEELHM